VVKDWFPVAIRGKASSVCAMAMSLGGIITISLTSYLLKDHGWQEIFRAYSLVGIVWAIAFYFYFRTKPEEHTGANKAECDLIREGESEADEGAPAKMNWGAAFRDRNTWALCGQLIFKAAGYNFFVTFFPAFLEYKYNIEKADAGMLTTYPLIGVVFGSLLGGLVIDGLYKKTGSKWISRCGVASGALLLTATFAFGSTFTGSAQELATVIAVGSFFSGVAMPCPWAASIDMGGKNPALVMGMMNAAGCLAGICISPLIGRLIDHIKRTDGNWDVVVYVHAGFYLCAALLWLVVNPNKPIGQSAEAKGDV
jgi:sugar phosphate permease